jgi:uncharacterized protein YqjF (DUF2071 family)
MAGRQPEDTVRWPVSFQGWSSLTFLHWRYPAEAVQRLLPDRVEVDTFDGAAWVSVTPFLLTAFRLGPLPPFGPLSTFPETNVRTYVRGPDGRDGLWFLSLEADSLPTVVAASVVYGVPYRWAEMSVDRGDVVRYRSRRRGGDRAAGHDITVRPGAPREPSALEDWLTGRWRAYTTVSRRLAVASVRHEPWPLHDVEVLALEETLVEAAGLPAPEGEPLAQWSPGVRVRFGHPCPV